LKKFITIISVILFVSPAFALEADFDGSGWVDFADFAIFAIDWQKTSGFSDPNTDINSDSIVDYKDLYTFADEWLTGVWVNTPPEAGEVNGTAVTFVTQTITLAGSDVDNQTLSYIILSTPNDVNCYIQDTASGCGIITEALCPYTVRNNGSALWLAADNNETFTFTYKVNDGYSDSNDANVVVVVSPNPNDHLSFNGEPNSYVIIPDNSYFDINDVGWAISFWYNNLRRSPDDGVIKKLDGGAGWEITTASGKLKFDLYDANGLVASVRSDVRISDGLWWEVLIEYNDDPCDANDKMVLMSVIQYETNRGSYTCSEYFTAVTFSNDANVIITPTSEFDHLRFWDNVVNEGVDTSVLYPTNSRYNYTESVFGIGAISKVRFKIDRATDTDTTITDDKAGGLVGTIQDSGGVKWTPWNWYWADINVQQKRRLQR